MTTELARVDANPYAPVVALVTDAVTSPHTARAYGRALGDFLGWWDRDGRPPLQKAVVTRYVAQLRKDGRGAGTINQRLVAIRKLAREAADNGLIDQATAAAIGRAEGVRTEGKRLGNWLTREQAQRLLELPDVETLKGLRDRALLAVLLGTGLRRDEAAGLIVEHLQQREGRWLIVDLVGKRQKVRSVPMPSWAKHAIDAWLLAADIQKGYIFRAMRKGDHVQEQSMGAQAVYSVVRDYAEQLGVTVRAHDLRRTFAKLAHKGSAPLEQIQLSLGHSSVQTTERYLGVTQDLTTAPCDVLGLRI
jgi:site-specific recombinase XerD